MKSVKLSEITKPKQWRNLPISALKESGYPVYGANGIIGYYDEYNHLEATIVITCRGATCGTINITTPKAYITSNAMALNELNEDICDFDYLAKFLSYRGFSDVINGAAQPQITRANLQRVEIPIPEGTAEESLESQKNIAYLLEKVERLIAQRKKQIEDLDEFLKSVFIDMFGDPVKNEKGWDKPNVDKFGDIITGNTPPRKNADNYSNGVIEWIKTDNIKADSHIITKASESLSEIGLKTGRSVDNGAILIACIAGSLDSIGRSAIANRKVAFNQQMNAIQPFEDVDTLYLHQLIQVSKKYIQNHASKGMKKILTKGDFKKIKFIKPPLEEQQSYSKIASKVYSVTKFLRTGLLDLETLYASLSQRAFSGELDLSLISLDEGMPDAPKAKRESTIPVQSENEVSMFEMPASEGIELESEHVDDTIIMKWFESYCSFQKEQADAIDINQFIEQAQERYQELSEQNQAIGVGTYDKLQTKLFVNLASVNQEQSLNEETNKVEVKSVTL